jgi:hypothetical protein
VNTNERRLQVQKGTKQLVKTEFEFENLDSHIHSSGNCFQDDVQTWDLECVALEYDGSSWIMVTVNHFGMDIKFHTTAVLRTYRTLFSLMKFFPLKMTFKKLILSKFSYKKKVMDFEATSPIWLSLACLLHDPDKTNIGQLVCIQSNTSYCALLFPSLKS